MKQYIYDSNTKQADHDKQIVSNPKQSHWYKEKYLNVKEQRQSFITLFCIISQFIQSQIVHLDFSL